mgnify:CR=1 FL=1
MIVEAHLVAHALLRICSRVMGNSLDGVVDVADATGLGAAVVVEVVALGSRHLGSVTTTNANRIVVLVGIAVSALRTCQLQQW